MATPPLHPKDPNSSQCDKTSSRCVIWQGADIPCIDLCTGDTIDDVISKVAVILCEVAELADLDVTCLLAPGEEGPETVTELVELIVANLCQSTGNINLLREQVDALIVGGPITDPNNPVLPLPPGLYYYDSNGDLITQLPLTEYVVYLASKIEELIAFNTYYKQQQELINSKFDALEIRVSTLENLAQAPPEILVISQGASHYIPGTVLPIDEAFWNFERTYVGFSGTVGTPEDLTTAISKQTPNLANLPQLSNPDLFMKNIAGWINSPFTLAHSFGNLWLTMTDLRARVQADINAIPLVPCILVPILSQAITSKTSTYATLTFVPNTLDTIQENIGYKIEVFDHNTDPGLLTPIHVVTTFTSPVNLVNTAFVPGQEYTIATTVLYDCGESVKMTIISDLLTPATLYQIKIDTTGTDTIPGQICTGADAFENIYEQINTTLVITLINKISGLAVDNPYPTPIVVKIRLEAFVCAQLLYQDVELGIIPTAQTAQTTFVSFTMVPCYDGNCGGLTTGVSCGVTISNANVEFDSNTIFPCLP